jgi:hypothetical protein
MFYKEFIELNPPIGTKVRFKDEEWLFIGYGKDHNGDKSIELATTVDIWSNTTIYEWHDDEFEIVGIPTYKSLPKYKVGDIVYWRYHKCIILEDRDDDYDKYFVYNTVLSHANYYKEQELFLEPQYQNDEEETVEVKNISGHDLKDGEVVSENEVEKLEVKGDEQE